MDRIGILIQEALWVSPMVQRWMFAGLFSFCFFLGWWGGWREKCAFEWLMCSHNEIRNGFLKFLFCINELWYASTKNKINNPAIQSTVLWLWHKCISAVPPFIQDQLCSCPLCGCSQAAAGPTHRPSSLSLLRGAQLPKHCWTLRNLLCMWMFDKLYFK